VKDASLHDEAFFTDICERLVLAVEGGLSGRFAAKRFGVAASTAIKWGDQWRRMGDYRAQAARRG